MKKFQAIKLVNINVILGLLVFFCHCTNDKTQKDKEENRQNKFYGNWLVKEYFDPLLKEGFSGRIQDFTSVSEFIISTELKDTLIMQSHNTCWIEKCPYKCINDTILEFLNEGTNNKNYIYYNSSTKTCCYQVDEDWPRYSYFKANREDLDSLGSAFLKHLNKVISGNSYNLSNPALNSSATQIVKFDVNGKVNGLYNYTHYRLIVGCDEADCEDMDVIYFFSKDSIYSYGIKFNNDNIDIYNKVLITEPDEKPWYRPGKLAFRLSKQLTE